MMLVALLRVLITGSLGKKDQRKVLNYTTILSFFFTQIETSTVVTVVSAEL